VEAVDINTIQAIIKEVAINIVEVSEIHHMKEIHLKRKRKVE
jgi:hypothetical protein